ncbi:MAG: Ig-like domain-containing protein, partial [Pirellulaceae bacterium]
MLHGGEDHGINGPHDADPNYNLSGFDISFQLAIYVDGQEVDIPVWGGQSGGDSINPVNTNGLIRIHPTSARSSYVTLDEVLQAWRTAPANGNANAQLSSSNLLGNHVDSEHYIRMFVNGTRVSALEDYQIHANDSVVLAYTSNPIVTVETNLGLVPIELFRDRTPITVANFLNYVNDGDYNDSFFHRFLPNFVLQGGGFKTTTNTFADPTVVNQFTSVTTDAQIQNEFDNWAKVSGTAASITNGNALIHLGAGIDLSTVAVGDRIRLTGRTDGINDTDMFDVVGVSDVNDTVTVQQTPAGGSTNNVAWKIFPEVNLTGTLAMAKVGGNPNSATSQFFINLNDNDASLDMQNGGFTVFGQILDHTVLQDIAALNDLSLFSIVLNGQQQVPPVTTSASGAGILAFNKLVNEFDLSLDVAGIPSGDLTGSHIHKGSAGVNGDIVIDLGSGSTYTQAGNQQLRRVIDDGILPALNVSDLQLNGLYVNVHTTANSDGEIRGQLTSLQSGLYSDLPTTSTDDLIVMQSFSGEAEIRGNVFIDADEDGVRDQNETGRSNFAVFADDNQNNQLDPGEATATTDNNGNYTLRVAPGLHHVRIVPAAGVAQTSPSGVYSVTVEIGDQLTGRDFGTFGIAAPTAIDLVSATDSGSSTIDNVTNYNNNGANRALQFQVTGVRDGALVRIRADGILIGETTVPANSGGTVIVTTDGTTTLSEGLRNIVATQAFGGATSEATAALGVNIDVSIASFTSTPPTTAMVGTELTYNAENADEGQANFVYSLNNAPSGAVINPSTGTLAWTPAANQSGHHEFEVVATDNAGNTRTQAIELDATKNPQVRVRLEVTDLNGNPLSQINVGSTFQLRAFVTDVRMDVPDNQKGVFSLYQDVTFNNSLATATSITHDTIMFGNSSAGTISGGLLDEIGSFSGRISPPGATESLLYTVTLTAVRSGTLTFTGDPADLIPAHQVGLFGNDDPIPLDEVDFGRDSIQIINPNFQITDDQFNFNEDTTANSLNVLTNDQGPQGSTLQIVSVGTTSNGGTVTIASDNRSLIYTPAANFFGNETFTYTVSDGSDEGVATVTVQVQPVNDAPTAVNDAFTVTEDTTNNSLAVLQNDLVTPDASTEKLKVLSVTQPAHGVVTIDSAGLVVRYTPNNDYRGTDTFTYTIQDDGNPALTSTATATVTVVSDNDPPTAVNDNVTVLEDSQNNVFDVLANDTIAPDTGETLTITTVTSGSRGGTVTVTQNGTRINYTPAANVFGEESFTYTISDGNGGTAVGTVRVTITPQNDAPNGVNDALSVAKNSQNNLLQVLNNDTITPDADETLTITAVSQGSQGGSLQIAEDG